MLGHFKFMLSGIYVNVVHGIQIKVKVLHISKQNKVEVGLIGTLNRNGIYLVRSYNSKKFLQNKNGKIYYTRIKICQKQPNRNK